MTFALRGLYAITDQSLGEHLLSSVESALQGGAVIVQYRDKSQDHPRREAEARALLALCLRYQTPLLINDDIELAHKVGAYGVHIGQSDSSLQKARALLGPSAIIGVTCHDSLTLASNAASGGADYIAFGAFFPSPTKPLAQLANVALLNQAKREFAQPVTAIGGITISNATTLIEAGADCVAVISDLWNAPDIMLRAREFTALFK